MSDDPDIQQRWDDLRTGLRRILRHHVAEVSLDDLVIRIIAELIVGPGWKPPLRPAPAVLVERRVERATKDPSQDSRRIAIADAVPHRPAEPEVP